MTLRGRRPQLVRRELAREGVKLACQLAALLPREPEAAGLAALQELHYARAAARFDSWGRIMLLDQQDRRLWDAAAIERAVQRLQAAVRLGRPGPYQVRPAWSTHSGTGWAVTTCSTPPGLT